MSESNILFDPVHPDAATTYIRSLPVPAGQILNQFLPDRTIQGMRVEVTEAVLNGRKAKYRSFDGNIPQLERDGFESRQVKLQPMSIQGGTGELEQLELEHLRAQGGSNLAIVNAIYDDFAVGVRSIRNAVEARRGELLSTGIVNINENGVQTKADFGVPTAHFPTAAVLWSDVANANPIEDLLAWVGVYVKANGERPAGMVVSTKILTFLLRNVSIRVFANLAAAGGPNIVSQAVVDAVLANFNLPPIVAVYDEQIEGQTVLDENRVIFVPRNAADLGNTYWGVTQTAAKLLSAAQTDLSYQDAPGLVGIVIEDGPPYRKRTFIDSINLPILNQPKRLFAAKVSV